MEHEDLYTITNAIKTGIYETMARALCFEKCSITTEGYQVLIKACSLYIVTGKCICGLL